MATRPETAQYILDQLAGLSGVSTRRMFGEYAVYLDSKVVGFICDDQFFLKPTEVGERLIESPSMAAPYPGAKLYYLLTDEVEQRDHLMHLVKATAHALPHPKVKSPRSARQAVSAPLGKNTPASRAAAKKAAAKAIPKMPAKTPAKKKVAKKTVKKATLG